MNGMWDEVSLDAEDEIYQSATYVGTKGGDTENAKFPYPNLYVEYELHGELAARIRTALDVQEDWEHVSIVEVTKYDGHSEYTQDNIRWHEIRCANKVKRSDAETGESNFASLLQWLDETAPLQK